MSTTKASFTLAACVIAASFNAAALIDPPASAPASQPSGGSAAAWSETFDRGATGSPPPGWEATTTGKPAALAAWSVQPDPSAPSKPNVLALGKTVNSGTTFNLLIADAPATRDVDLSVSLRADTGREDQGGGLIWRCRDENHYYICRLNPLEHNYRVYKVVDGKRTQLQSAKVSAAAGRWYSLRAVMIGERIECYLDGGKLLEATDGTIKDAGRIGLWTKADAASSFDDLKLQAP